ncbi:reverse transcriptase domain-containing protein [Tanacetum coccineum]
MLTIFPKNLTRATKRWIKSEPSGTITTWDILKDNFHAKYFSPSKTARQIEEIHNFKQEVDETLFRSWERFKGLLFKCQQNDLNGMQQVVVFYKVEREEYWTIIKDWAAITAKPDKQGRKVPKSQIDQLMRATKAKLDGTSTSGSGKVQVNALDNKFNRAQRIPTTVIANQPNILPSSGLSFVEQVQRIMDKKKSPAQDLRVVKPMECLERVKKVEFNKPIVEALKKEPKCLKGLEDDIESKSTMEEMKSATLNISTTTTILEALPHKREDPRTFYIPLSTYNIETVNAFTDLGATINVMSLSMFKTLGLDVMKETKSEVELANVCLMKPLRIAENVLVECAGRIGNRKRHLQDLKKPEESDDYDTESPDKPFKPTPFVNARKQILLEVFKEALRRRDIREALDLDKDDLEIMEDFIELNPNEGSVDKEEDEFQKRGVQGKSEQKINFDRAFGKHELLYDERKCMQDEGCNNEGNGRVWACPRINVSIDESNLTTL